MKCPLLEAGVNTNIGNLNGDEGECLEEKCAWWYAENNVCSVVTLAQGSVYLHRVALDIAKGLTLIRPK